MSTPTTNLFYRHRAHKKNPAAKSIRKHGGAGTEKRPFSLETELSNLRESVSRATGAAFDAGNTFGTGILEATTSSWSVNE